MKVSISGVRGIYGTDLDLHEIIRFSQHFSSIIKSGKCVIGRDSRPSGRIISDVVSATLINNGIDVYDLGLAPTPMVFREARNYGAGFIVTASHNPMEWNGLKFIVNGRGIFEAELDLMLKADFPRADVPGKLYHANSNYINDVKSLVGQRSVEKKLKIGLDPGGGATCGYADILFERLGHKPYSINDIPGISSRGPDPTADSLDDLRCFVNANKLDFGFAFDLDGDRLVAVDSNGNKLTSDSTLLICVASSYSLGMKKFVTSIDTSIAIEKYVKQLGGQIYYSKVGEANVVSKMIETGAEAGGEGSSAGFIMPAFNMCRDGFLASATISALDKKIIDDCLEFASRFAQIRSKIPANSQLHVQVVDRLHDYLASSASEVITIDGIKALIDENSWVLVRPSNTEHAIRVSVEAKAEDVQGLYKAISEKVKCVYEQIK